MALFGANLPHFPLLFGYTYRYESHTLEMEEMEKGGGEIKMPEMFPEDGMEIKIRTKVKKLLGVECPGVG